MYFLILALILMVSSGCQQTKSGGGEAAAARVGHYRLSQNQAANAANPGEYIDGWLETSMLALEAERRKLDQDAKFSAQMESIRAKLLTELLLEKEYARIAVPSEEATAAYYKLHQQEFQRVKRETAITTVSGLDDEAMAEAAKQMRRGAAVEEGLRRFPGLVSNRDNLIDAGSMPPPFGGLANASEGTVVGPVEGGRGRYIFRVDAVMEAGTIKPLEQVRDNIIFRITEEERMRIKEVLLKELRKKYKPEVYSDRLKAAGIHIGEGE